MTNYERAAAIAEAFTSNSHSDVYATEGFEGITSENAVPIATVYALLAVADAVRAASVPTSPAEPAW